MVNACAIIADCNRTFFSLCFVVRIDFIHFLNGIIIPFSQHACVARCKCATVHFKTMKTAKEGNRTSAKYLITVSPSVHCLCAKTAKKRKYALQRGDYKESTYSWRQRNKLTDRKKVDKNHGLQRKFSSHRTHIL